MVSFYDARKDFRMEHEAQGTWTEREVSMKAWASRFYMSAAWKKTRDAYLTSQDYICERCGEPAKIAHHKICLTKGNIDDTGITLCWDNLEALCQDCHNKEHHKQERELRYGFNADGRITPPIQENS